MAHIYLHTCTLGLAKIFRVPCLKKLNSLSQNLISNQFWGRSGARKVCPQAILGQPFYPPVSLRGPGPKMAWGHIFQASDWPQKWFGIRFWSNKLSFVWGTELWKFSPALTGMRRSSCKVFPKTAYMLIWLAIGKTKLLLKKGFLLVKPE